jgi:hypothetical protein
MIFLTRLIFCGAHVPHAGIVDSAGQQERSPAAMRTLPDVSWNTSFLDWSPSACAARASACIGLSSPDPDLLHPLAKT